MGIDFCCYSWWAVLGVFLGPYIAKLTKYIASSVKTTVKTVAKQAPKSLCFVEGTLVESQNGHIPIETVEVLDENFILCCFPI